MKTKHEYPYGTYETWVEDGKACWDHGYGMQYCEIDETLNVSEFFDGPVKSMCRSMIEHDLFGHLNKYNGIILTNVETMVRLHGGVNKDFIDQRLMMTDTTCDSVLDKLVEMGLLFKKGEDYLGTQKYKDYLQDGS